MKKTTPGRIILAALVGGVIMFAWGFCWHALLEAGGTGPKPIPSESTIVPALQAGIAEPGLYFFPPYPADANDAAAMQAFVEKLRAGPRGLILYNPEGGEMMSLAQMGIEFGGGLLASLLLAVVLAMICCGVGARVAIGAALGAFAWASIDVSYWNWYGFPTDGLLASLVEQGFGWLLCAVGIALVLGKTSLCRCVTGPPGA